MIDQRITINTARSAKLKGFDLNPDGEYYTSLKEDRRSEYTHSNPNHYPRVTQALLSRWLREVHGISVEVYSLVDTMSEAWTYNICIRRINEPVHVAVTGEDYRVYEEAFEVGLQKGLDLII